MPISTPPVTVCWVSALIALARPKSATLTRPPEAVSSMRTFSGFTSRWIRPARWAAASAEATGSIRASARAGGIGASVRMTSRSVWPGTYSIARKTMPSSSPWSKTETTCGWESRAAARASRTKRAANSSSSPIPGCITLTATRRSSRVSVAS